MRDIISRAQHFGLTIGSEWEGFFFGVEYDDGPRLVEDSFLEVYPHGHVRSRDLYTGRGSQFWNRGTDGTIRIKDPECDCGCNPADRSVPCRCTCHTRGVAYEIRTPSNIPLSVDRLPEMVAFTRALKNRGWLANNSCGFHVHVGAPDWTGEDLANLARLCNKYRPQIDTAIKIDPRRKTGYAQDIPESAIRQLDGLGTIPRAKTRGGVAKAWEYVSRFTGLNLQRVDDRGSVEFRWANGTASPAEVEAYVLLGVGLVIKAKEARHTSSKVKALKGNAEDLKHWRVTLNQMGLIGREFKSARTVLTRNFPR